MRRYHHQHPLCPGTDATHPLGSCRKKVLQLHHCGQGGGGSERLISTGASGGEWGPAPSPYLLCLLLFLLFSCSAMPDSLQLHEL